MKARLLHFLLAFCLLVSCSKADFEELVDGALPPIRTNFVAPFLIEGKDILKDGTPIHLKGVNALQTFGLGDPSLMNEWNVEIVREFIGNLGEQPISGEAILASDDVWYHSLQNIADQNRAHGKITIFCPFGWVNESGERQLLTGLNPADQSFYQAYKDKMRAIAEHFKDQTDVWIEVWNEPYNWDNQNGYSHDLWLSDMQDMVDNLRGVNDFHSVILVPGNEQGQSEDAITARGNQLLEGRYNILFDLHAYEKWLLGSTESEVLTRLQTLQNQNFAFVFGEVGIQNVGDVMPVQHFLNAVQSSQTTTLAWLWNQNSEDNSALLTDDGQPNSTNENNNWGTVYRTFLEN